MKTTRLAALSVLLCLLHWASAATGARAPAKPVALVYSLAGRAALTIPFEERRPLRLFDRLPAGTTVEVRPGSRLALAFANGRRYELGGHSRAKLGRSDLTSRSGPVHPLPAVSPLPTLLPIAPEERAGLRAGAVRIRAERIAGLYPRRGTATLAGATTLRFEPVEGAGKYQVEVHDRQGNVVFGTETADSPVNVPAGILQPGVRYDWTVRTVERVGPVARGEADFVTLPARRAEAREALRRAVERMGDGASLALLAEVDRSLGLLIEARDEFRVAVRSSPGDTALAAGLAELERHLPYLQSP
ncbi:MAG TPA: hypothetical protein VF756_27970 [Thermoanaerobaculia bacterium]